MKASIFKDVVALMDSGHATSLGTWMLGLDLRNHVTHWVSCWVQFDQITVLRHAVKRRYERNVVIAANLCHR